MATYSDAIAAYAKAASAFEDQQDAAIADLQGDIDNLNAQILVLQNSPGPITETDQATLDGLQARGQAASDKLTALAALTPPVIPPATGAR